MDHLISRTLFGSSWSRVASTFFGSGLTPSLLMTNPKIFRFLSFNFNPCCRILLKVVAMCLSKREVPRGVRNSKVRRVDTFRERLVSTLETCKSQSGTGPDILRCSSGIFENINYIDQVNHSEFFIPCKTMFINSWKTTDALTKKASRWNWKSNRWQLEAVFSLLSSSSFTCQYPNFKSKAVKYLTSPRSHKMSSIKGRGNKSALQFCWVLWSPRTFRYFHLSS